MEDEIAIAIEISKIRTLVEDLSSRLEKFTFSAFVNGDLEGHRRYHQNEMEWRDLRNKLMREVLMKIAGAAGLASFAWVCYAVWLYFKLQVIR